MPLLKKEEGHIIVSYNLDSRKRDEVSSCFWVGDFYELSIFDISKKSMNRSSYMFTLTTELNEYCTLSISPSK